MTNARLIAALCLAETLSMLSFATFPALLPTFMAEWRLSGTEAGWLNGLFSAGYMLAVPVLTALTDRIDARRIYLVSVGLTLFATLAFAFLARDFWSAAPLRLLAGAGLAGTYMPGLKALTDRLPESAQPRAVSFYTASFAVGSSASYLVAGLLAEQVGWQGAFMLTTLGIALGGVVAALALRPQPAPAATPETALLDFRPVLRNRPALGYILAYAAHSWEIFGYRAWLVAFLAFALARQPGDAADWWSVTAIAAGLNLLGTPASILGNEAALRLGRRRTVCVLMLASAALAMGVGFSSGLPFGLVVALLALYGALIMADSSAITSGTIAYALPAQKGATMAVHSMAGFGFAFLGSLLPGLALDAAGGPDAAFAWGAAFASMGAMALIAPLALLFLTRDAGTSR